MSDVDWQREPFTIELDGVSVTRPFWFVDDEDGNRLASITPAIEGYGTEFQVWNVYLKPWDFSWDYISRENAFKLAHRWLKPLVGTLLEPPDDFDDLAEEW